MRTRSAKYFVGDFETTVYKGQTDTEVWASACVELYSEDVKIFHSIGEQLAYFRSLKTNIVCYYHNLKFDGSFWLDYLMIHLGLQQAVTKFSADTDDIAFLQPKDMPNNTFAYSIAAMGQWYKVVIKLGGYIIELRDSLKLLPFSVKKIGKSFGTKHKKLEMEYTGFRYAGCEITEEEQKYIANDVLVVKEAIEIMFEQGHKKLTIGSCCLAEYKKSIGTKTYERYFPNLYDIEINKDEYGAENAGEYIHNSYHGGWCYLARGKENKMYGRGCTADVNSLYPSMMSSESGNVYPIETPTFWTGNFIPDEACDSFHYYFVRFKTRFYIKEGKLPFVQIKRSFNYCPTDMLETSDVRNPVDGKYYPAYIDFNGNLQQAIVTMTMTMTDFKLFKEHYELVDFEILDGCYFKCAIGIFDSYMEKYKKIKMESKGALRELAKLFLNNLYGKMASSPTSNFKVAYVKEDNTVGFYEQRANDKIPGYIAVGSAITSYARNFTIRAAQANYHGVDKPGFIYADTDSIHCNLDPKDVVGIKVHPTNFCCWKLESTWDTGLFVRQKTYAEHVVEEDLEPVENPYYNLKCAGMPDKCKQLFLMSMDGYAEQDGDRDKYTEDELSFLQVKRELSDFKVGLRVPGKLLPKRIRGGVLLTNTTYEMR